MRFLPFTQLRINCIYILEKLKLIKNKQKSNFDTTKLTEYAPREDTYQPACKSSLSSKKGLGSWLPIQHPGKPYQTVGAQGYLSLCWVYTVLQVFKLVFFSFSFFWKVIIGTQCFVSNYLFDMDICES